MWYFEIWWLLKIPSCVYAHDTIKKKHHCGYVITGRGPWTLLILDSVGNEFYATKYDSTGLIVNVIKKN